MTFKFKRKRILLSEKNKNSEAIGYARATNNEYEYLEEQIKILKGEGCSLVFSEFISLDEEIKPQLNQAINCLSEGDQLINKKTLISTKSITKTTIYLIKMQLWCSGICI